MKRYLTVLFVLLAWGSQAQSEKFEKSGEVVYGLLSPDGGEGAGFMLKLSYSQGVARLEADRQGRQFIPEAPKEVTYLDYRTGKCLQQAAFQNGPSIFTLEDFNATEGFKTDGTTEKILDYQCRKYTGTSFSNSIELWVTAEAGILGTPNSMFPVPEGLVMKYVRNGNMGMVAREISIRRKSAGELLPADPGKKVTAVQYRIKLANAYVRDVAVFSNQQINWGAKTEDAAGENADQVYRFAGGTVVVKKVNLPDVPDGTSVFAELKQQSNGDAYDRTGSVFVIPVDKRRSFLDGLRWGVDSLPKYISKEGKTYQGVTATADFSPVVELIRFFTPFGIHHFNDKRDVGIAWEDTTFYRQEISELLPLLRGETWIGVFIGNYDGGGHKVSLNLKYHLNEREVKERPAVKHWIMPLFTTTNIMEMAGQNYGTMFKDDTLKVSFDVPGGVKNVTFRYISTGHGGWGEGDEFVPKTNEIFLDSKPFFQYTPWRTDCGRYRAWNPASGNFWNGLSSSDYSRSGWCPGTASDPVYMPVKAFSPGRHTIGVYIPLGPGRDGMFSAWNICGVLIGEIDGD